MVVLYSRLTSLSTLFSFRMSQAPLSIPLSISDPYLLTLTGDEHNSKTHGHQDRSRKNLPISSLELRAASYGFQKGSVPSGPGALYREKSVRFYFLSTLYSDLSLQRYLYVSQATTDTSQVCSPVVQQRQEIPEPPTYLSGDGFIVSNRASAKDCENLDSEPDLQISSDREGGAAYQAKTDEDSRTLNFEWLERGIQSLSARVSTSGTDIRSSINLDECLATLKAATENKLKTVTPQVNLL